MLTDWSWECSPDDLLDDYAEHIRDEVGRLASEIVTRDSMLYLDGSSYTGLGPNLQIEGRGFLLLTYLTDVRGQRVLVVKIVWSGPE